MSIYNLNNKQYIIICLDSNGNLLNECNENTSSYIIIDLKTVDIIKKWSEINYTNMLQAINSYSMAGTDLTNKLITTDNKSYSVICLKNDGKLDYDCNDNILFYIIFMSKNNDVAEIRKNMEKL